MTYQSRNTSNTYAEEASASAPTPRKPPRVHSITALQQRRYLFVDYGASIAAEERTRGCQVGTHQNRIRETPKDRYVHCLQCHRETQGPVAERGPGFRQGGALHVSPPSTRAGLRRNRLHALEYRTDNRTRLSRERALVALCDIHSRGADPDGRGPRRKPGSRRPGGRITRRDRPGVALCRICHQWFGARSSS